MTDSIFLSLLNNTFTIKRIVRISDGSGGWEKNYQTIATVNGRMVPKSGSEKDIADQERQEITHVFYAAYGSDVVRGDKIVLGIRSFDVLGVREPSLAQEHIEVDCFETQLEEQVGNGS